MFWEIIALCLFGYLVGSVPFGLVSARLAGLGDIRKIGSGNIGATNVLRTGHKGAAFATLIGDAGKGALAVLICRLAGYETASAVVGLCAVIGHCYPIGLSFKGGKGVATAIATIAMLSWPAGLVMALTWLVMSAIFKISSLSALTGFVTAVITSYYFYDDWLMILGIAALSFWRHRDNIKRLLKGQESKISFKKSVK